MAKHGRGLICVPTTGERLQQLGIDRMVQQNRESFRTDFQVSVDAARGMTHRHFRRRPRPDDSNHGRADRRAGRFRPARPHFSVARAIRRRAATRRPHRGGGGPGAARRAAARRRAVRNHERRRHHGAAAAAFEICQETQTENLHHRRPDRIPPHARKAR